MSDSPWIKFYPSDWLAGTSGLTAAERGVYITILALVYENEGPVQMDEGRLARRCGVTKAAFTRAFDALCDEAKLTISAGMISNRRSEKELSERAIRSQKASASASQRWSEQGKKDEQKQQPENANASAKECASDANQNQSQTLEVGKPTSCPFSAFWTAWPNKVSKAAAEAAWKKLPEHERQEALSLIGPWFEWWREQNPQASPIHAATYLNKRRWQDERSRFKTIPGGRHDQPSRSARAVNAFVSGASRSS